MRDVFEEHDEAQAPVLVTVVPREYEQPEYSAIVRVLAGRVPVQLESATVAPSDRRQVTERVWIADEEQVLEGVPQPVVVSFGVHA